MGPVIDCHCHAGPGDGLGGPWDSDAPLAAYLRRAQAAGIARSVLFATFHSDNAVLVACALGWAGLSSSVWSVW